ncbi:MAG: phospholipid carrier-dependent glycosyltransferase [Anaerolineales bacterium]|nr:phospholipid carrier-dependent glycosyltransferase [Anaerolineales bacterium]MCB9146843.1 phospholipid carrier-dependent glycosyltransferase [Anaerolineales bacterium]
MRMIQDFFEKIQYGLQQRPVFFDILFLLLAMLYVLSGVALVPFHGDESAYLIISEDYDRIVKEGGLDKVLYSPEGNGKQYLRLSTGGFYSFVVGWVRDLTNTDDPIEKWLWGSSWEDNLAMGNMPPERLLNLARYTSAVMGALSVVFFFLFVRVLSGSRLAAWVSTLALVTQGAFLVNVRRAMQEGPKFLFLMMTVYLAACIVKNIQRSEIKWLAYALLGVATGLTLAAKQDTAFIILAVYLGLALVPVFERLPMRMFWVNGFYLGAATLIAYAAFLVFMPVFWGWWESSLALLALALVIFQLPRLKSGAFAKFLALAGGVTMMAATLLSPVLWVHLHIPLVSMADARENIVEGQTGVLPEQESSLPARINFLFVNTISSQVMYLENPNFDVPPYHELIREYEASALRGRTGSWLWDGLLAMLALSGVWALLRNADSSSLFALTLLLVTGVSLPVLIPLFWQRYYLIMQIPYLFAAGIGAEQIWSVVSNRSK